MVAVDTIATTGTAYAGTGAADQRAPQQSERATTIVAGNDRVKNPGGTNLFPGGWVSGRSLQAGPSLSLKMPQTHLTGHYLSAVSCRLYRQKRPKPFARPARYRKGKLPWGLGCVKKFKPTSLV